MDGEISRKINTNPPISRGSEVSGFESEATRFLAAIFGDEATREGSQLLISYKPLWKPKAFTSEEEAGQYAVKLDKESAVDVYFNLGLFKEQPATGRGKVADVCGIVCLWADIDIAGPAHSGSKKHAASAEVALSIVRKCGLEPSIVVHSGHGLHAYWLLEKPWLFRSDDERKDAAAVAKKWVALHRRNFNAVGFEIDSVGDLTRVLRVPGTTNRKTSKETGEPFPPEPVRTLEMGGQRYTLDDIRALLPESVESQTDDGEGLISAMFVLDLKAEPPADKFAALIARNEKFKDSWERRREFADQSASTYDFSLAAFAAHDDWTDQEIVNLIVAWRRKHGELDVAKLERSDYLAERVLAKIRAGLAEGEQYSFTDLGNAQRFADRHGQKVRYCYAHKAWHMWDGRAWRDNLAEAERLAKEVAQVIGAEASGYRGENSDFGRALKSHAKYSRSQKGIFAMLKLAQSESGIPIGPDDFDSSPWLLNCRNGVLNLINGQLQPHDPAFMMTKIAPVDYDPEARSERWENFLKTVTDGNEAFVRFLQQAIGYSLTGSTQEEKLFFVHGPAATGKTTFVEAIKATLGDYAKTADFETFLKKQTSGIGNDVARLAGARFVASSEVDEGKQMADKLIKMLTGGDAVTARFMYKEIFAFTPQLKLWMVANHKPHVNDKDSAMWRRILLVALDSVIPEGARDPKVKEELRNPQLSGPAILAWAVKGCLEWQKVGKLEIPDCVQRSTANYREEMNPVKDFLDECCTVDHKDADLHATSADLLAAYDGWAKENTDKPLSQRELWNRLLGLKCQRTAKKGADGKSVRGWRGIQVKG